VLRDLDELMTSGDELLAPYGTVDLVTIYHYTSIQALKSIVETRSIWCSNIKYSNDPSEVIYGYELVEALVREKLPGPAAQRVIEYMVGSEFFAASFSLNPDSLPQWRAYCRNGRGLALGLSVEVLSAMRQFRCVRMVYDPEQQRHLAGTLLDIFAPAVVQYQSHDDVTLDAFSGELGARLLALNGMFKSEAYRSEEEVRLYDTWRPYWGEPEPVTQFRATTDALIPYVVANLADSASARVDQPFERICIGPFLDDSVQAALELFLKRQKQTTVTLQKSEVRMRPE